MVTRACRAYITLSSTVTVLRTSPTWEQQRVQCLTQRHIYMSEFSIWTTDRSVNGQFTLNQPSPSRSWSRASEMFSTFRACPNIEQAFWVDQGHTGETVLQSRGQSGPPCQGMLPSQPRPG